MSQVYTVEAELIFESGSAASAFCKTVKRKVLEMNGTRAIFDLEKSDFSSPFGCFKVLTTKGAHDLTGGVMYADFNASYGWESVMYEIFTEAMKHLSEGSVITIYPDMDERRIEKRPGEVVHYLRENDTETEEIWKEVEYESAGKV